jgi:hypothetical protein
VGPHYGKTYFICLNLKIFSKNIVPKEFKEDGRIRRAKCLQRDSYEGIKQKCFQFAKIVRFLSQNNLYLSVCQSNSLYALLRHIKRLSKSK